MCVSVCLPLLCVWDHTAPLSCITTASMRISGSRSLLCHVRGPKKRVYQHILKKGCALTGGFVFIVTLYRLAVARRSAKRVRVSPRLRGSCVVAEQVLVVCVQTAACTLLAPPARCRTSARTP